MNAKTDATRHRVISSSKLLTLPTTIPSLLRSLTNRTIVTKTMMMVMIKTMARDRVRVKRKRS